MKLTKRTVEALEPDLDRDRIHWDSQLPGFGLRVFPNGRKSYLIQYRMRGRSRRYTLGPHGVLTLEQARQRARSLLAGVHEGKDPAQDRSDEFAAPTVAVRPGCN